MNPSHLKREKPTALNEFLFDHFGVILICVFILAVLVTCVCCFFCVGPRRGLPDPSNPDTPWTDRSNNYKVRAKNRTDKIVYLKKRDGKWIHTTHSTTWVQWIYWQFVLIQLLDCLKVGLFGVNYDQNCSFSVRFSIERITISLS